MKKIESHAKHIKIKMPAVARNKVRRIEIALRTAGGRQIETLMERLRLWKAKLGGEKEQL